MCEGDHNSMRPQFLMDSIAIFLVNVLQVKETDILTTDHSCTASGKLPWAPDGALARNIGYDHDALDDQILQSAIFASMAGSNTGSHINGTRSSSISPLRR